MTTQKTPAKMWVEALRSGQYQQGRSYLCKSGRHCCLGVLCDVYQREVGGLDVVCDDGEKVRYNDKAHSPPEVVTKWAGLENRFGKYTHAFGDDCETLTDDNDEGKTFAEIADIIESRPPGLFADKAGTP